MASYTVKVLKERPVDAIWVATWKWTVLALYYGFLGFCLVALLSWLVGK